MAFWLIYEGMEFMDEPTSPIRGVSHVEQPDLSEMFTDEEMEEIKEWVESLTVSDLAKLKTYWESRSKVETLVQ